MQLTDLSWAWLLITCWRGDLSADSSQGGIRISRVEVDLTGLNYITEGMLQLMGRARLPEEICELECTQHDRCCC